MISFLRRYRQPLIIAMSAVMLIGIFVGLGGYFFTGRDTSESVALVGKAKIPYLRYRVRVNQYLDSLREKGVEVSEAMQNDVKQGMLRDMIVDEILAQQAEAMGLRVSDMELALSIQNAPPFRRDGKFDQELYFQAVRGAYQTTPEQFEAEQKRSMLSGKLKNLVARSVKITPEQLREEYVREKGSEKGFEKGKEEFAQGLRQRRALDAINFLLRQMAPRMTVQSYLEQREQGG